MKSMFGIHYNLKRKYDMNTQRSANRHEQANTTKSLQNCFHPKTYEITSRPALRSSMNSSSKIPAAAQYKHLRAIVEVFTIVVFEKGKLLGERLARQVWNVDLDSARHLDILEFRGVRKSQESIKVRRHMIMSCV